MVLRRRYMTYTEVLDKARETIGKNCRACTICDGKACGNRIPGPGAKGVGDVAIRNYNKWQEIRINMDTISENIRPDMSTRLFGKTFKYPFFAAPVGSVSFHYDEKYDDVQYNRILLNACCERGIAAFSGDGVNGQVLKNTCNIIKELNGMGVPTIKPWNIDIIREKMDYCNESNAFAVAMDIDGSGLPFLKNMNPPSGPKTVDELAEIVSMSKAPFIIKGIMTVKGALKAKAAGAAGIVVSNHGGRVLDQCPATAEVLEEIANALKGSGVKIFVDGGIRSGVDIFKALALGADAVMICRPFVPMVFGGGEDAVKLYIDKLGAELEDTMLMCGAKSIKEISRDMLFIK
jgi:NAD(P)H-dependent flavin oxidoreductase YrpB (nitropropane dioxygenase family)